jgi:FPC/CPF motif-containing protein YcgG
VGAVSAHYLRPTGLRYAPAGRDVLDRRIAALDRPGEHLWIMLSAWHLADPASARDDDPKLLDAENLLTFQGPACFKCEKPYSAKMAKRRCLGSVTS